MPFEPGPHADLLAQAIADEAGAQRALLDGDRERASAGFRAAADAYRASWEAAPPRSYGRLVGMLKAAVLAGDAGEDATYARRALGDAADSPAVHADTLAFFESHGVRPRFRTMSATQIERALDMVAAGSG